MDGENDRALLQTIFSERIQNNMAGSSRFAHDPVLRPCFELIGFQLVDAASLWCSVGFYGRRYIAEM
jgi:hypothetical protein